MRKAMREEPRPAMVGGRSARASAAGQVLHVDDLEVHVVRKRQKNMYARVKPDGRIAVTAPLHFSDGEIAWFIREKRDLILKHRERVLEGKAASGDDGAGRQDGTTGPRAPSSSEASGPPSKKELAEWRAVVEAFTPALVERWAPAIGVRPGALAFRNMVSRWGSCNVKTGRICINVQLAAFPPECLEYVVVHELCHLIEPNHGPRFKALLDAHLPRWREAEAILRRRGVRR